VRAAAAREVTVAGQPAMPLPFQAAGFAPPPSARSSPRLPEPARRVRASGSGGSRSSTWEAKRQQQPRGGSQHYQSTRRTLSLHVSPGKSSRGF
jgi:hypothetical protein